MFVSTFLLIIDFIAPLALISILFLYGKLFFTVYWYCISYFSRNKWINKKINKWKNSKSFGCRLVSTHILVSLAFTILLLQDFKKQANSLYIYPCLRRWYRLLAKICNHKQFVKHSLKKRFSLRDNQNSTRALGSSDINNMKEN